MPTASDILDGPDGDLLFENGDLATGPSDDQHIKDILESAPGHYRQYPLQGVNVMFYANSKNTAQTLKNVIFEKLTMDAYIKIESSVTNENGKIVAKANAQRK